MYIHNLYGYMYICMCVFCMTLLFIYIACFASQPLLLVYKLYYNLYNFIYLYLLVYILFYIFNNMYMYAGSTQPLLLLYCAYNSLISLDCTQQRTIIQRQNSMANSIIGKPEVLIALCATELLCF